MSAAQRGTVAFVALALGLTLAGGLVAWAGADAVLAGIGQVGWGILGILLLHLLVLTANALSLRPLLEARVSAVRLVRLWWIADSVNALLPVAQIGGELTRIRLLMRTGVEGAPAGAAVIASLTAGFVTQILFAAAGLLILVPLSVAGSGDLLAWAAVGLLVLAVAAWLFWRGQRHGLFLKLARRLEVIAGDRAPVGGAAALDQALQAIHARRDAFLACCAWRLAGWLLGALQVLLVLHLIAEPGRWLEAFVLESLGQAAKSAGFIVPGALGPQEGGFVGGALLLGLSAHVGLTISLVKRVRDLLLGLPALLVWQWLEGRSLLSR